MRKIIITIGVLIYVFLANFWPDIFLKMVIFLPIAIIIGLTFFLKLKRLEKIVSAIIFITFGLFLFNILPSQVALLIKTSVSISLAILIGIVIIFIFLLIEIKLYFIINRYFTKD